MCDQDHFEQDRQEYEAGGLVTRRQFGILLGENAQTRIRSSRLFRSDNLVFSHIKKIGAKLMHSLL